MIHFDRLTYTYPGSSRPALADVTLRIDEGEFVLVAGASGAGKSTLLRCLNGLVPHFTGGTLSGSVVVDGRDPVAEGPQVLSRVVGFVFQDPEAQFVLDRVEDEIAFALENAAMPPTEMRVRVEEVLDLLDLAPLRRRPLDALSGGERQRVAIAAALAFRPRVLVLDEPTSQLDPQSAEDVLQALVRLNRDLGLTVILAEQRLERILPHADHVVYLPSYDSDLDTVEPPTHLQTAEPPTHLQTAEPPTHLQTAEPSTSIDGAPGGVHSGPPRLVLQRIGLTPPLVTLGKRLGWDPLPLTIKEGRAFAREAISAKHSQTPGDGADSPSLRSDPVDGAPGHPPLLRVENLSFSYNGTPALREVSLGVGRGELVALLGRNGSGKTTLLRCIVGLLRPERGAITLMGEALGERDTAEICQSVGYLPQEPDDLLFADTVAEEMSITLRNHGLADSPPIVPRDLLERLGLGDLATAYPRDLSVGQRQRVALGAVTVTHPRLLLLDEPTRGLDYAAKRELVRLLREWQREGVGVLLVTHDVELVAQAADRIVLLSQGEIIADDVPQMLAASPLFAPQIARLFPGTDWLTAEDALEGLNMEVTDGEN